MSVKNIGAELSRSLFGLGFTAVIADALVLNPFAGAIAKTTGGDAEALTLADAVPGTLLYVYLAVDGGGDGTITPVTATGWSTLVLATAYDAVLLNYVDDTIGWVVLSRQTITSSAAMQAPNIEDSIDDVNGLELFKLTATGSAVNEITVANAAQNGIPSLIASGDDTHIGILLAGKGTDPVSLGQATSSSVLLVASQPIADENGNELIKFGATGSAVNEVTITNAATNNDPTIIASGETNVGIQVAGKGTGQVSLGQATSTSVLLVASQPISDENGNELFKFTAVGSALNEITVANAATGTSPSLTASGQTDVSLELAAKGTGVVASRSPTVEKMTITTQDTAVTLTIAQLLTKYIDSGPGAGINLTLPTAAALVAGMGPDCAVGDSFEFVVNNTAAGADTVTMVAGGATLDGTVTIAQNVARAYKIIVTDVTGASEAYLCIGLGN